MERATISRQQQTQRAFLGAALMDPARAREYIIKLVPGMFDEGVSRAVFSAVQQLTMAGEPVDVITVINRASAGRPADEIRPGVVAMAETCPSVSNVGSYAAQILEDYRYSLLQGDLMKCMAKDECSKLYKVQQAEYAKNKYATMPPITDMARRAAIKYLVECGLVDQLKKLDYVRNSEWNYADHGLDARKLEPVTLDLTECETDALLNIEPASNYHIRVRMLDPADTNEVIAESLLTTRDLFDAAKRLYINRDDLAAYKAEVKGRRDQERARQDEAEKWQALARQELEAFDSWPLVTRLKDLGLTIRERKMADGGRLIIAVDDLTRFSGHVDGFQYRECFAVRLGPNGERAGRDGDINALEWYKRWYSTGAAIENYIAEDIERSEKK